MGTIHLSASLTVRVRTDFSIVHLTNAAYFAGQCAILEAGRSWPQPNEVFIPHRAFAANAIIASAATLEAFLNEVHLKAADRAEAVLGRLDQVSRQIVELWDTVERQPTLRKYEWLLSLGGLPPIPRGHSDYQGVADVIQLRDALVHAKSEWDDDSRISDRLETRLRGKFAPNGMAAPDQAFFPHRALGAGAGSWAVKSALEYMDRFCLIIEARSPWRDLRGMLEQLLSGSVI